MLGGAGLKGAAGRTKHGDGSTTASGASEEHTEPRESSRLGLWRCSLSIHCLSCISKRLGIQRYLPSIYYLLLINV